MRVEPVGGKLMFRRATVDRASTQACIGCHAGTQLNQMIGALMYERRLIYDQVTGQRFRHGATFLRWRPDKAPRQCTMDQLGHELRPAVLAEVLEDLSPAAGSARSRAPAGS